MKVCRHPVLLWRQLFAWASWIGLVILAVACQSSQHPLTASTPIAAPTAMATSTVTQSRARTATAVPTPTPVPTELAATLTPRAAAVCHTGQGQLGVSSLDSTVLARRVVYSLYLPPCYGADPSHLYPVLYLLHGINTDNTQWPDLNVAPDADILINEGTIAPFVVVMPDGNYRAGEDYAAFVLRDLIPQIEQTLHVARDGQHRAIGGLSQGGYWALKLALTHPELFSAVGGHSTATSTELTTALAQPGATAALRGLRIYLDVGNDDPLEPEVSAFAAALQAHQLAPVFHIYPGGHNRPYWRSHTAEYLLFYARDW